MRNVRQNWQTYLAILILLGLMVIVAIFGPPAFGQSGGNVALLPIIYGGGAEPTTVPVETPDEVATKVAATLTAMAPTATLTPTVASTATPTATQAVTATVAPSATPTPTASATISPTATATATSTPTHTPTATNTPAANVWSVDFSSDFGVNAQEESCSKFTDVRVEQGFTVLAETFAGAGSQMYAQTPASERPCLVKAGTYINLQAKGLVGAPSQSSYDFTGKIVNCAVRYVPELVNQKVWVEFRIQDSQFRNESLPGFFVTSADTTFNLVVGQGIRDNGFDVTKITALKVETRADDPASVVQIPGGEIFRHTSCVIQ